LAAKNIFGHSLWLKKKIYQIMGHFTYRWLMRTNRLHIEGTNNLVDLPERKVLLVANHETVFTDVIAILHAIFAALDGQKDSIERKSYLRRPKLNIYYVAARETMKKGFLPKLFARAGPVTIDRTWRQGEEMVQREVNPEDTRSIGMAIEDGWVITFPQGTTRKGAPVRKGTAHIIKQYQPIVVPVRVKNFRKAFDKTGLKKVAKNIELSLTVLPPLTLRYDELPVEEVVDILEGQLNIQKEM